MTSRRSNQNKVTLFLVGMTVFTLLMTFYAGPRVMAMREDVRSRHVFYKCIKIVSGDTIQVQLRGWDRPNTNSLFEVKLAGVEAPPLAAADDPALVAWARERGIDPAWASRIAASSQEALSAFLRRQNLMLESADGTEIDPTVTGQIEAHAYVFGVDAGDKQLENGLVLLRPDAPQRHAAEYAKTVERAKTRNAGLYRATP
jgi:endonuclease YncB( thermonuclease family)